MFQIFPEKVSGADCEICATLKTSKNRKQSSENIVKIRKISDLAFKMI